MHFLLGRESVDMPKNCCKILDMILGHRPGYQIVRKFASFSFSLTSEFLIVLFRSHCPIVTKIGIRTY